VHDLGHPNLVYRMSRGRTTRDRGNAPLRQRPRRVPDDDRLVVYGVNAVLELLRHGERIDRLHLGDGPRLTEVRDAATARGVHLEPADRATLDRVAGSPHHQGAVAVTPPFPYASLDVLLAPGCGSALVLDGVQDPRNLGAILRTARAAGVAGVVLPSDRSARVMSTVAAASAGLLFGVPIVRLPNLVRAIDRLREAGFWTVGLVPDGGTSLYEFSPPSRPALVVGGEGEGLRPLVRRSCDFAVTIPMAPGVESLNVAVAASLALYEVLVRPSVQNSVR
jgi:23S rRNA (guanosine2251-2'-O)-methyltransferase